MNTFSGEFASKLPSNLRSLNTPINMWILIIAHPPKVRRVKESWEGMQTIICFPFLHFIRFLLNRKIRNKAIKKLLCAATTAEHFVPIKLNYAEQSAQQLWLFTPTHIIGDAHQTPAKKGSLFILQPFPDVWIKKSITNYAFRTNIKLPSSPLSLLQQSHYREMPISWEDSTSIFNSNMCTSVFSIEQNRLKSLQRLSEQTESRHSQNKVNT